MKKIYGKEIAEKILADVKKSVKKLPHRPLFCDILVGNDVPSLTYVNIKGRVAKTVGMDFLPVFLKGNTNFKQLGEKIKYLNNYKNICGLVVQLPLPAFLNVKKQAILNFIRPEVDVDCIGEKNTLDFYRGKTRFIPPAAAAVLEILKTHVPDYKHKNITLVGQGQLVGRPALYLLEKQGVKVDVVTKKSTTIERSISGADVIISAAGKVGLIGMQDIKKNAYIIDAGTSEEGGSVKGDVDLSCLADKAVYVTPVPGGVGPVTVAMLMKNVAQAAESLLK